MENKLLKSFLLLSLCSVVSALLCYECNSDNDAECSPKDCSSQEDACLNVTQQTSCSAAVGLICDVTSGQCRQSSVRVRTSASSAVTGTSATPRQVGPPEQMQTPSDWASWLLLLAFIISYSKTRRLRDLWARKTNLLRATGTVYFLVMSVLNLLDFHITLVKPSCCNSNSP
ncbi:uncharacterized protein LOC121283624 isoform X1 [Carcharodon carcharias]|uniref:uncharacterized protein LOC121283624 isoform X1 n=1 Tax=Carcharodon carcharias TaxID=13397 RepID=UPI001B7E504E|nr:uncharacterized protein LOC121283624 isoform X1 [Carcharodon carcharias]